MRDKMFILKPSASSCGRGIRVVQGTAKISNREETIVSTYIDNPLVIKNKKFDMRMYVVVTSYHPLRIYLYEEGLARFATEDYSNDPNILKNKFVHLTNFSINKRNVKAYVKNEGRAASRTQAASTEREGADEPSSKVEEDPEQESSSKWSLKFLRSYLQKHGGSPKELWAACKDVIIKTILCAEPSIVAEMNKCGARQKCCFEVYGFDIMFDANMKPWVLEVNCLPSLSSSSVFDKQVKTQLISDTFTLIGFRGYDKTMLRNQKKPDGDVDLLAEIEEPQFNKSLKLSILEDLGGCVTEKPEDPEETRDRIQREFYMANQKESGGFILDNGTSRGPGTGFSGDELLSRDELNIILDLEDEGNRLGQFDRIFPLANTASKYYGFMEVKRYQNALYCAWLSTPLDKRRKLITNCQAQYCHTKSKNKNS